MEEEYDPEDEEDEELNYYEHQKRLAEKINEEEHFHRELELEVI